LRKAFWWVSAKAELPKMRIHDLRHSFVSFAANMGENLNNIKGYILEHTRITITEIYAHHAGNGAKMTANNVAEAILR
jgi:site-specific recombinase XerD